MKDYLVSFALGAFIGSGLILLITDKPISGVFAIILGLVASISHNRSY